MNLLREMTWRRRGWVTNRDNFTSNVKKNLNKIKAQAQAMMSTEESVENEWANGGGVRCREEEENSEEEEELEEYPVQKEGWRVVFRVTEETLAPRVSLLSRWRRARGLSVDTS